MAFVQAPVVAEGDSIVNVDPSTKLWPDYKAEGDEYALITMHTIPFEGSVGLINQLTATRLNRKGWHTAILLYGPAVLMASNTRGFPTVGADGFAGNQQYNKQLKTLLKEAQAAEACKDWKRAYRCYADVAIVYNDEEGDLKRSAVNKMNRISKYVKTDAPAIDPEDDSGEPAIELDE